MTPLYTTLNQEQITEQPKFTYSPLGKSFEKQTKTIEDQGEKQIKTINDNKKQLMLMQIIMKIDY